MSITISDLQRQIQRGPALVLGPGMTSSGGREAELLRILRQAFPDVEGGDRYGSYLDYADAVRSHVSQWLRGIEDGELDAPNRLTEHAKLAPGYDRPALQEALAPLADQPVWLVLSLDCFAHGWAHVEEIRLLARAGHPQTSR